MLCHNESEGCRGHWRVALGIFPESPFLFGFPHPTGSWGRCFLQVSGWWNNRHRRCCLFLFNMNRRGDSAAPAHGEHWANCGIKLHKESIRWTLVFGLTFFRQPILWLWRWFIFMMWQFVTSICIIGKWLKKNNFFYLANQTGLLLKHCSNKDILMLNCFVFAKYLYLFVPSCRMLEDDLKLSSDEEENEQVRLSFMLHCLNVTPWHWPGRLSWVLTNSYKCQVVVF